MANLKSIRDRTEAALEKQFQKAKRKKAAEEAAITAKNEKEFGPKYWDRIPSNEIRRSKPKKKPKKSDYI
tara:strand:+ start:205 stop:414 length:210 start_codon:yes stop_codon:yes gene_type:complete